MLTSIFHAGAFRTESVLLMLLAALAMGLMISVIYKQGSEQPGGFSIILCVIPVLVTSVIMIINGNLGTSVAVLGAFGLIRFRSAPGSAREIGFLFYAMAVGLALGMGFLGLAVLIAVLVGITVFILDKAHFEEKASRSRRLRITIPEDLNYTGIFDDLFARYTTRTKMECVRTTNLGTMYELFYTLQLKNPQQEKEFIDALRCRNGNLNILLGCTQQEKNAL